ncbi:MAG: site-specific integrase [Anaerolineae bacterium]|jgi:site-specific recombinase XerD|nr:site-specific integrase [Anaerolineae bacterium]
MSKQLPLFPIDSEHALTRRSTLGQAIPVFQEHLRQEGRSPHTINAFTSDLGLLCELYGEDRALFEFNTTRLNRFMEWIEHGRGVPCSRKSYARRVTTLKVFFKYLKNENILSADPAEALVQRSGAAPLQPIVEDDDVDRLLAYTLSLRLGDNPDARPDLLVRLLIDTGIKKGECMALKPEHILRDDPTAPLLLIRHRKPNNVYKERKVALDPDWLVVFDEYMEQYNPPDTIFDCTARNLEYVLSDVADGAGITGKVSFEVLRWTSAVRAYQRGADLEALREKMGLSRISWRETSAKIKCLATQQDYKELI